MSPFGNRLSAISQQDVEVPGSFVHQRRRPARLDNLVAIVRQLADRTKAPVALHLDHGKSVELARAAVGAGYTSVMIDASRESFEVNLRETRDIVAYAHARSVHVEAELGTLGGIDDLGATLHA
jgi:fructose-bisphosphate aldolase class II